MQELCPTDAGFPTAHKFSNDGPVGISFGAPFPPSTPIVTFRTAGASQKQGAEENLPLYDPKLLPD